MFIPPHMTSTRRSGDEENGSGDEESSDTRTTVYISLEEDEDDEGRDNGSEVEDEEVKRRMSEVESVTRTVDGDNDDDDDDDDYKSFDSPESTLLEHVIGTRHYAPGLAPTSPDSNPNPYRAAAMAVLNEQRQRRLAQSSSSSSIVGRARRHSSRIRSLRGCIGLILAALFVLGIMATIVVVISCISPSDSLPDERVPHQYYPVDVYVDANGMQLDALAVRGLSANDTVSRLHGYINATRRHADWSLVWMDATQWLGAHPIADLHVQHYETSTLRMMPKLNSPVLLDPLSNGTVHVDMGGDPILTLVVRATNANLTPERQLLIALSAVVTRA